MKRLLFTLLAVLQLNAALGQSILVYRNDRQFDRLKGEVRFTRPADGSLAYGIRAEGSDTIALSHIDSIVFRLIDVPTLYLETTDSPTLPELTEKDRYLSATLRMEGNGHTADVPLTACQIKGRGNSTWNLPKKPYRIKFYAKQTIAPLARSKNYVLLANFLDDSKLKNALAFWLAQQLGFKTANRFLPCDVVFNGRHKGSYLLTEKIGINTHSVDIDENTGVLLELSKEYDEKYKFRSKSLDLPVMVKDPDFDELTATDPLLTGAERLALWQQDFDHAEELVCQGRGFEAFDLESFVDYYLVNEVVCNDELGFPKSFYLYKGSLTKGEKYRFGPLWDFDISFDLYQNIDGERKLSRMPEAELWVNHLMGYLAADSLFQKAYRQRMEHFINVIYPRLQTFINTQARLTEPSAKCDGTLWKGSDLGWHYAVGSFDYSLRINELKDWIEKRVEYLVRKYGIVRL